MSQLDIQHIIFEGQGRAEIFSFRPENIEKEKRGNLFLVGKTTKTLSRQDPNYYILNSVAAILKKEYYSSLYPQSVQSFEGALKKVNAFLSKAKPEVMQSLEMVTLALAGSQVTFSSLGGSEVLLLRNERLFRLAKARSKEKNMFLHVTKGKVKSHDKLIVGTSDLTYWLQNSSFTSRLIKRALERVREYLYQERKELKDTKSLALLYLTINGASEFAPLEALEGLMQEVKKPEAPVATPSPLPTHFAPLTEQERNPLASLKRYYIHHWHGKQSTTLIKESLRKTLILARNTLNRFPTLSSGYSLTLRGYSWKSPRTIAVGIAVLLVMSWGISGLFSSRSSALKDAGNDSLAAQQNLLFSFPATTSVTTALLASPASYLISQGRLFQIDTESKKMDSFLSIEGDIKGMAIADGTLYAVQKLTGNQWQVVIVDPTERSVHKETLTWPLETDLIKDIRYYENNLYILEGFSGQIIKYSIPQFTKPSSWISTKYQSQVNDPISFAIDGSLYLIEKGASGILQFRGGQLEKTIPLPPGIQANLIITTADLKNLYLFNSIKGEVAVLDKKTHALIKTFSHPQLIGITSAELNEAQEQILVLNPKGIFTISMTQENKAL